MDISVVVCTRNRASHLPQMLEKLQHLRAGENSWELVFVDNGSSDATYEILQKFCATFFQPARVIQEFQPGLAAARNAGWRASTGAIISFTDDDCYPDTQWLEMIGETFKRVNVGYVGGRVLLFDALDAPVTIQTCEARQFFPGSSYIESGHIIGANFSCSKKLLEATNGFDIRLGAGTRLHSGEDTDLLIRASQHGFEGYYEPSIVVFHHHRRRLDLDIRKLYSGYARGRGAISMKAVLESNAKTLYLKNWYWRMASLIKQGKFKDCLDEIKGALYFLQICLVRIQRA